MNAANWVPILISSFALALSIYEIWNQYAKPARLRWERPLMYSLGEIGSQDGSAREAMVVPLTIYNAGACLGTVNDVGLRVARKGDVPGEAYFQASMIGQNPSHLRVCDVERNSTPMRPILIQGHQAELAVVLFERRSRKPLSWCSGEYLVEIYSLNSSGGWCCQTSFEFTLKGQEGSHTANIPRWTKEAILNRDAFCDSAPTSTPTG